MDIPDETIFLVAKTNGKVVFNRFINLRQAETGKLEFILDSYVKDLKDMVHLDQ